MCCLFIPAMNDSSAPMSGSHQHTHRLTWERTLHCPAANTTRDSPSAVPLMTVPAGGVVRGRVQSRRAAVRMGVVEELKTLANRTPGSGGSTSPVQTAVKR